MEKTKSILTTRRVAIIVAILLIAAFALLYVIGVGAMLLFLCAGGILGYYIWMH